MPAATMAQTHGISTPKTNAQLPFPLFVNGHEISAYADARTYKIRDSGISTPSVFSFEVPDHTAAVAPWIAKKQRVIWKDAVGNRILFQGFVDNIRRTVMGPWVHLAVDVIHISCVLDYSLPIIADDLATHAATDQAMIQYLVGTYVGEPNLGAGGYVQQLAATMPASLAISRTQTRSAIEQTLLAANVTGAYHYVDDIGYLHTLATGDVNAPYTISDAPNYSTSVPAVITVEEQGSADVEAVHVYGGTPAGSGLVLGYQVGYGSPPLGPLRVATIDAPQATDVTSRNAAAQLELQRRQNAEIATITVTGYDGWSKGQLITVTNAALGWSSKQMTITSVAMATLSGDGKRRYTITAGTDPVQFSARFRFMHTAIRKRASNAALAAGYLGGASG